MCYCRANDGLDFSAESSFYAALARLVLASHDENGTVCIMMPERHTTSQYSYMWLHKVIMHSAWQLKLSFSLYLLP